MLLSQDEVYSFVFLLANMGGVSAVQFLYGNQLTSISFSVENFSSNKFISFDLIIKYVCGGGNFCSELLALFIILLLDTKTSCDYFCRTQQIQFDGNGLVTATTAYVYRCIYL
eukprot:TRINITY_DN4639_c0_g1_i8.p8 TRINITY_DN4639_c0_g1~~TRINITY_DN4639_c0_g1_i8.p8  ORF type:complete len:113 (+),score=0.22 TRINITY_DN4639_c0_g1_i8:518-856(+)